MKTIDQKIECVEEPKIGLYTKKHWLERLSKMRTSDLQDMLNTGARRMGSSNLTDAQIAECKARGELIAGILAERGGDLQPEIKSR